MTPQQILEKVIEKAVNGGWDEKKAKSIKEWIYEKDETWGTFLQAEGLDTILFDHSFAKAYFGEKSICTSCMKESGEDYFTHDRETGCNADYEAWYTLPAWMVHLKALALTPPEERLSYLERYL